MNITKEWKIPHDYDLESVHRCMEDEKFIKRVLDRKMYGEYESRPMKYKPYISLEFASHLIRNIRKYDDRTYILEMVILSTDQGKLLRTFINEGGEFKLSLMGEGSGGSSLGGFLYLHSMRCFNIRNKTRSEILIDSITTKNEALLNMRHDIDIVRDHCRRLIKGYE